MKKALTVLGTAVLAINISAVQADNGAFVIQDDTCQAYGVPTLDEYGHTDHVSVLTGQYAGGPFPGNGQVMCQGTHPYAIGRPLVVRDDPCYAFGYLTEDSLLVATPGGQWTLVCNFPKAEN